MKVWVWLLAGLSLTFSVSAQEYQKNEGAREAEFNSDAQERDHEAQTDSREILRKDSLGVDASGNAGEQSNEEGEENGVVGNNNADYGDRSGSSSGSPAILAGEDGTEADGTNNVQRATPNTAGSPVPGSEGSATANEKGDRLPNRSMSMKEQESIPLDKAKESGKNKKEEKRGKKKK